VRRAGTAALLAILAWATSCGIDTRTAAFRCDSDIDCEADRRCEEGYCTVGPRDLADASAGGADAPVSPIIDASPPDAFLCPTDCTGGCLEDFTCLIDCSAAASCGEPVVCPANLPCQVTCSGENSCAAGVSCADSCSCEVQCTGAGSCATAASCPPAPANKCRTGNGCNTTGHPRCDEC
jgi:hypothetical protein